MAEPIARQFAPDTLVLEGRFRIVRWLSGGGMGEVYVAEQLSLGRQVAIKVLRAGMEAVPGMPERFRREAKLLSTVDHPCVVRVIDYGTHEGSACLVLEFVEGDSLDVAEQAGPFPPARALRLLRQLAEGLAAVHAKGIVHRDLKPQNVVLTQTPTGEHARLLDFGIARVLDEDSPANRVTQAGFIIGTPEFLSPEQATGGAFDERSDIYSFGVLAYQLVSGKLPYPGPTPREYLVQHATLPAVPLVDSAPGLKDHLRLVAFITQCLAKEPMMRPASATALVAALDELILNTSVAGAQATPVPERSPKADSGLEPTALRGNSVALSPTTAWKTEQPGPTQPLPAVSAKTALRIGGASVLVLAALAGLWLWLGPGEGGLEAQGKRLLDEGKANEALAIFNVALKDKKVPPSSLWTLRGEALHSLKRHGDEWASYARMSDGDLGDLSERAFVGLVEDYARTDVDDDLQKLLSRAPADTFRKRAARLASGKHSTVDWGALRLWDHFGADKVDLAKRYGAALEGKNCSIRAEAARRLGEIGGDAAVEALERLVKTAKPKALGFIESSCGHDEANAALRRLRPEPTR